MNSGELPPGSHHTQPKLFSRFLFQTQAILLWLQDELKIIARLSSAVFYIITKKLLGAFYVDQKKKGLLPSTLLSEHEQWGTAIKEYANGIVIWEYPVTVTKVLKILTGEAYPTAWLQNTSVLYASISAPSDNSIGASSANIITLSITSGGSVSLSSHTTTCFMIGIL